MLRIMLFIHGSWVYSNLARLFKQYNKGNDVDKFGKLLEALIAELGRKLETPNIHVVRTCLFAGYATNYDVSDSERAEHEKFFFIRLKKEYCYEIELLPIDFEGRRLRKEDRDEKDQFEAKEKCVDILLATKMLYFAALPDVYDVAVAVVGDRDFIPLFRYVRQLGKRIAVASIRDCCTVEFSDLLDEAGVRDLNMIWLDDLLGKAGLNSTPHQEKCTSSFRENQRIVLADVRSGVGKRFYW